MGLIAYIAAVKCVDFEVNPRNCHVTIYIFCLGKCVCMTSVWTCRHIHLKRLYLSRITFLSSLVSAGFRVSHVYLCIWNISHPWMMVCKTLGVFVSTRCVKAGLLFADWPVQLTPTLSDVYTTFCYTNAWAGVSLDSFHQMPYFCSLLCLTHYCEHQKP